MINIKTWEGKKIQFESYHGHIILVDIIEISESYNVAGYVALVKDFAYLGNYLITHRLNDKHFITLPYANLDTAKTLTDKEFTNKIYDIIESDADKVLLASGGAINLSFNTTPERRGILEYLVSRRKI